MLDANTGNLGILALSSVVLAAELSSPLFGQDRQPELDSGAVTAYFAAQHKTVVTFIGYSDAGYEDPKKMLATAREVLGKFDPKSTIVNIGATPSGIGAVYELAKSMGFPTTGIVSTEAKKYDVPTSPHCDKVFYVKDDSWGGYLPGGKQLSPTSRAMVDSSTLIVGIGGGQVGADEISAARQAGKKVQYFPADMNHQLAIEKAKKKGQPIPTDFRGAAHQD